MNRIKILFLFICFAFTGESNRTLFIGDSITAYYAGWQAQICKENKLDCVNLAKAGMATDWMLTRLKTYLRKDHAFKQVVIYGGVNDRYMGIYPMDSAIRNVQRMVNIARLYNVQPIVIVGYDGRIANKNTWVTDKYKEKIIHDEYILYQERLTKEIKNATIIPVIPITKTDLEDGIHLSAQGHKTYVKYLTKFIF